VPLKYDELQNKIVITDASGVFRLSPENDKIDHFTIQDHAFIKILKDSTNASLPQSGFYEVLYDNSHMALLKKESKKIVLDVGSKTTLQRYIISTTNYYIKKGNTYYLFNKQKQVLEFLRTGKPN